MEFLSQLLPILIYILLIVLLFVGIIIGIKIIITMNRVEKIVDNVEHKVNALNGIFDIIEITSGKITGAFEKVFDFGSNIIGKLMFKGKGKEEKNNE